MQQAVYPVFDGHNDTITKLREIGGSFFAESDDFHITLPLARRSGLIGGFFAVWVPDTDVVPDPSDPDANDSLTQMYASVDNLPPMMSTARAQEFALISLGHLLKLEREGREDIRIVRTVSDIRNAMANGHFAVEVHFEGAEPIDPGLDSLEVFYAAGLRSLGLVWSRSNLFGHGVPFGFPGSPDSGPGLTDAGKALVRACNELGIMLDVSHLNEKGFWDIAAISDRPIVATHCGSHVLCQSPRNLTDKQLDAIRDSNGIVGINFHVGFLNPDGANATPENTPLTAIADHLGYIAERIGIDKVGLGSDFDGARMPGDLVNAGGLPALMAELKSRGYDDDALAMIGYKNWLRIFEATWVG
ncbi:MAG: dipeptidase [Chloroflexota bacterium]|nr:dipeptidase [Chloroflexota bacterium]